MLVLLRCLHPTVIIIFLFQFILPRDVFSALPPPSPTNSPNSYEYNGNYGYDDYYRIDKASQGVSDDYRGDNEGTEEISDEMEKRRKRMLEDHQMRSSNQYDLDGNLNSDRYMYPPPPPPIQKPIKYNFRPDQEFRGTDENKENYFGIKSRFSKENERVTSRVEGDDRYNNENLVGVNSILDNMTLTKRGRLLIALSSTVNGAGFGFGIAKASHVLPPFPISLSTAVLFFLLAVVEYRNNSYAQLVQTFGLLLILLLKRAIFIRRQYSTTPYIKSLFRPSIYPRQHFPPLLFEGDDNPWKYQGDEIEGYSMIKILIAMTFVGGTCGGNLPLIPTWIGALVGSIFSCYVATLRDTKGDLCRVMGMKCVALIGELSVLNEELGIMQQTGVVCNKILDKLLILDRKHGLRTKVSRGVRWGYSSIMSIINGVRSDMGDQDETYVSKTRNSPNMDPEKESERRQQMYRRMNEDEGRE